MSFWSRLEDSASKNEMRIALLFHDEQIIYKDLFSKANNYAYELAYRGIEKDDIVCVLGQRSLELFACILGIVQAGAVFLLIDSEDEWSKVEYRMMNSKCRYAFVDQRYQKYNSVPEAIGLQDVYKREYPSVKCIDRNAEDTMYLAYTSGSTAQEKAVMVSYGNMESYVDAFINVFGICDTDINVQQTPLGYDGLCEELFSMLFTGGKLLLLDKRILKSPRLLHKELLKNKVTLFPTTPLILNELNRLSPVETIKKYISCADVLKKYHYSNLIKHTQIYNTYGPTETTVCATYYLCGSEDDLFTPIGTPLPFYEILVVSEDLHPVIQGQSGEILIGGKGVAKGYYNNEALTQEKFIYINGERVFRTGDYGYYDTLGVLRFEGRRDSVEKLKGIKVDCSKIESALMCSGLVSAAIAHVCADKNNSSLCVFYIPFDESVTEASIKACLKERLSVDHLPKTYINVESIPQKSVGKVDYSALEAIFSESRLTNKTVTGKDQIAFLTVFQNVLGKNTLLMTDMIRDVGMDSISFIQIVVELEELYEFDFDDEMLSHSDYETIGQVYEYVLEKTQNKLRGETDGNI